jgi:hypothetical protein
MHEAKESLGPVPATIGCRPMTAIAIHEAKRSANQDAALAADVMGIGRTKTRRIARSLCARFQSCCAKQFGLKMHALLGPHPENVLAYSHLETHTRTFKCETCYGVIQSGVFMQVPNIHHLMLARQWPTRRLKVHAWCVPNSEMGWPTIWHRSHSRTFTVCRVPQPEICWHIF